MLHSIKDALYHGAKHPDVDYEDVLGKFQKLDDTVTKLKEEVDKFSSSLSGVFIHSHGASVHFASLLQDSNEGAGGVLNPYEALVSQARICHIQLNAQQGPIANRLAEDVLKPLDEYLIRFAPLRKKVLERVEVHNKLEYYLNKIERLQKERNDRLIKGQAEKSSETEKMERNQEKLNGISKSYQTLVTGLSADLHNAWNGRTSILGPALAAFIQIEKHFTEACEASFDLLHVDDLQIAPLASHVAEVTPIDMPIPEPVTGLQKPMLPGGAFIPADDIHAGMTDVQMDAVQTKPKEEEKSQQLPRYGEEKVWV